MQGSNMASDTMPATGFFEKHRAKIAFAGPDECWLWTAGKLSQGYGAVNVRGKVMRAHRQAYEVENGAGSAEGFVVRHKCDTPACVNPAHLERGTVADNNRDMVERGRQVKGANNAAAKISEADVLAIRATYVRGCATHGQPALARRFGVSQALIGYVVRRELWKHI
jgi:hypothetical protein